MDQCDFTGPFEALARFLDCSVRQQEQLDVLLVPGGHGQEALMQSTVTERAKRSRSSASKPRAMTSDE